MRSLRVLISIFLILMAVFFLAISMLVGGTIFQSLHEREPIESEDKLGIAICLIIAIPLSILYFVLTFHVLKKHPFTRKLYITLQVVFIGLGLVLLFLSVILGFLNPVIFPIFLSSVVHLIFFVVLRIPRIKLGLIERGK